jgi:peroxiredoxin
MTLADALEDAFVRCRDMDGSLNERLDRLAAMVRDISPPFADSVDRLVARLELADAGADAPAVGDPMPPFILPDEEGHLVSLERLVSQAPVAITFHRGHWCPYCRINTHALARAQKSIEADGATIVAIMPDRQQFAAEFKAEAKAAFPVLTDMDNGYALALNLAIWMGDEMAHFVAAAGIDVPSFQGNDSWIIPIPATFVVGTDGRVKSRFVDPDYRKRAEMRDLIAAVKSAR